MSDPRRTTAPFGRRTAEVVSNVRVGAYLLLSVGDRNGPRDPRPGQFYMLAAGRRWGAGADERPYLPRAFSFARAHADGTLEFLMESVGPGTERLAELERGEPVDLLGPLGVGFDTGAPGRAILVGGGIGVAPLLCLDDELGEGSVLLGFRSADHAEAGTLFARPPQLATDDGSVGTHGFVTELLSRELDGGGDATVFACGPAAMLEAVRALCAERGVRSQLALESVMACGFGACFGCVQETRSGYVRLCVDGPVLDGAELETALSAGAVH